MFVSVTISISAASCGFRFTNPFFSASHFSVNLIYLLASLSLVQCVHITSVYAHTKVIHFPMDHRYNLNDKQIFMRFDANDDDVEWEAIAAAAAAMARSMHQH